MFDLKQQRIKQIKEWVSEDPTLLGSLLKLVANDFDALRESEKNRRDSDHFYALVEMLDNTWAFTLANVKKPKLYSNLECVTLLEACDIVMPDAKGKSPAQEQLLKHLAKSCKALGWKPDDDFITNIRKKKRFMTALYNNKSHRA